MVDDLCGKAEIPSVDQEVGAEGTSLSLADIKMLVNEILPIHEKRILHLVPVDTITILLNVLDHQVQCGQGLSVDKAENSDCRDAIALQLLLKLKRHLKFVFGLDDARCQAFSLKEYPKAGETLHRQNIPFNISDTLIRLPTSFKDMVEKYQEFKASLREDTVDYSVYTANVKKRPAPRILRGKVTQAPEGYDEDESDDEEWTCGPRKLNFSGQMGNGGRITRQRK